MSIYSDPLAEASGNFLLTLAKAGGNASGNSTGARDRFLLRSLFKGFRRMSHDSKLFNWHLALQLVVAFQIAASFS